MGRVLRGALLTNTRSDHVRAARSRGLSETALVLRHALRNGRPAPAMSGPRLGAMFTGLVVVETVFAWPGLGTDLYQSIPRGDFPAITGVTLELGVIYVVTNTVVDILEAAADRGSARERCAIDAHRTGDRGIAGHRGRHCIAPLADGWIVHVTYRSGAAEIEALGAGQPPADGRTGSTSRMTWTLPP